VDRDLQTAYGIFIGDYARWHCWATLTFKENVSEKAAVTALKRWLRRLAAEMVKTHIPFAWVTERQERGTWHLHLLLAFPGAEEKFDAAEADRLWRRSHPLAGFTKLEEYDEDQGAAFYMAKEGEPDLNVACSRPRCCRRRGGCVEAPSAW
jgi:hypothetical protein